MTTAQSSGDEDADYFRANIWGMGLLRSAMQDAKVLDFDYENPQWPKLEREENETDDQYQERYDEAAEPIISFRSTNPDLVPVGKFGSNDGWHVVPEECEIIANGLDKVKSFVHRGYMTDPVIIEENSDRLRFVRDFSNYCRHAAKHGGFKVW